MKGRNVWVALLLLGALTACHKDEDKQLTTTYSYKTSGEVVTMSAIDTLKHQLPNEAGLLDIIDLQRDDSVLVTWSALTGPVYSTTAKLSDGRLELRPFTRTLSVGLIDYDITVSGAAQQYDESYIFDLQYEGVSLLESRSLKSVYVQSLVKKL